MSQDQIFNTPETLVLITQAKQGDADAFDILLTQYGPLIEHRIQTARARRPDLLPEDEKDLRQEAHLAFYRALLSYNAEQQNVSFGLYAKICIENALISALRKLAPIADLLDYETMISLPADREEDPSLRLREQEDYEALSRRIARILSPFENRIWQRYIAGMTAPDIARQLKKDTRSIHNAIYRIRNKLRNASGITDKK